MSELLRALTSPETGFPTREWGELFASFWARVRRREVSAAEAAAVAAALTAGLHARSARALVASLIEPPDRLLDAVNIVGTGGGRRTFNISTAAAFVAAAAGARVIKTGSRAHTSAHGSFDLLERLGVPLTSGPAETAASLERHGLAFAGRYVYPTALRRLAAAALPVDLRAVGGAFNRLGPLLAAVPVAARLVGVSDPKLLPVLRAAADPVRHGAVWLAANEAGLDELVSFAPNTLDTGTEVLTTPEPGQGTVAELAPPPDATRLEAHFHEVLEGSAPGPAVQTVILNAAALLRAAGQAGGWPAALEQAREAVSSGRAAMVLKEMRR